MTIRKAAYFAGAAAALAAVFVASAVGVRTLQMRDHESRWDQALTLAVGDLRGFVGDAANSTRWAVDDAADSLRRNFRRAEEGVEDVVEAPAPFDDALRDIRRRNVLVLATTNEPTTYFIGQNRAKGYEYELASAYSRRLGVRLDVQVYPSAAAVMDAVEAGRAHLGAAHLKRTPLNEDLVNFGPSFMAAAEGLVCERDGVRIGGPADLEGVDIVVPEGSPFVETLQERAEDGWPVQWREEEAVTSQMLAAVADHRIDCTVADEQVFEVNRRYFPNLVSDIQVGADRQIAWALAGGDPDVSATLHADIASWLGEQRTEILLADLDDAYFAFYEEFDYVDLQRFRRAIRNRLPLYRELFERYGLREDIDWRLLAAVAWQESRWNPDAVSPTGVRGMMMLTRRTAREVGVDDRTDVAESIEGGAAYLSHVRERVPADVLERDRWWFAAAAYNVGFGHLMDARGLSRRLGWDDDRWRHVREALPLLEDPEYYRELRYGYARGREPVRYVRRIRQFQDILEKRFPDGPERFAEADY